MHFELTNREISILIWFSIIVTVLLVIKPKRDFFEIIKLLFSKNLLLWYASFTIYLFVIIYCFKKINFWSEFLWKDFWFWLLTIGMYHFYNLKSLKNDKDFKKLILKTIAFVGFIEFIINFYTFDLVVEFFLIPFLAFISLLKTAAESKNFDNSYDAVVKILNSILILTGFIFFSNSIVMTFYHYDVFFSHDNMKSFLLPVIFTILFLPMLYLASFYMKLEIVFININWSSFFTKKEKKAIKKAILFYSFLNLDRLDVLAKYDKADVKHTINIKFYFKSLLLNKF